MPPDGSRFSADVMLGRLARWLRVLGHDTAYETDVDDPDLVARADAEGRVLLTRDRHLVTHLRPARSPPLSRSGRCDGLRAGWYLPPLRLRTRAAS
jgi:hypothetical protein